MISCLVDLAASTADEHDDAAAVKKAFLEAQNEYGETALHYAIKRAGTMHNWLAFKNTPASMLHNKHVVDAYRIIENLTSMDPDLACIVTDEGTSPLFLAISLGEMDIVRYLIVNAKGGNDLSYYSGSDGQNILHAAVSCGHAQALLKVLNWLNEPKTSDNMQQEGQAANRRAAVAADLLIKQLTSQRDKKNGSTPLHLAASLWGFQSTQCLFLRSWKRQASSAITKLLDVNPSMAYQADKEGLYPIHDEFCSGIYICSLIATYLLLYPGVPAFPLPSRFRHVNLAYGFMMNSGRSLLAAFGLGLYVTLHPVACTVPIAIAVWMSLLAAAFTVRSESIDSILFINPTFPRRQKLSAQDRVLGRFVCVLERFWPYILIFGIPAIRKWARAK